MSDAEVDGTVFVVVFGGLFLLRAVAATVVFYFILPRGDRCPNCDSPTIRLQPAGWNRLVPFLRSSWCTRCGWQGLLRRGELTPEPQTRELTKL